jgi:Protein of unknown function (DUF3110)
MRVFVLLFGARTENEGIHTLKVGDRNIVLMFENEDDAARYGLMLEAQNFATATVECLDSEEIEEFCQSANYECKLVPEGTLELPPETNLEQMDWQADGKQADAKPTTEEKPEFSINELETIRRRLEGLL